MAAVPSTNRSHELTETSTSTRTGNPPKDPAGPRPEVLAPAGDWDCLNAAINSGADAVYFGLQDYNARHRAANFRLQELPELFDHLHRHGVRGYVTLNTLLFSEELDDVVQVLGQITRAGADAVIVQDLGLAALLQRLSPQLPVHASTQMTLTEARGIELARRLGIERTILARELSVAEIEKIAAATTMPLEVFVHGALCVAYSGQCLTSEAIGGRSANRGQCAQACRMPYQMLLDGQLRDLGDQAYLLSPQDLAGYELVGRLTAAGICSLKIEGRLKGPTYVAVTTQTYRRAALAAAAGQPLSLSAQQYRDLSQSFSRGFSPGFLEGVNHQQLVQGRSPKKRGVRVGLVVGRSRRGLLVELDAQHEDADWLKAGDGVVLDQGRPEEDELGGRLFRVDQKEPRLLELILAGQGPHWQQTELAEGTIVWRTDDPTLPKRLPISGSPRGAVNRTPIHWTLSGHVGGPLQLKASLPDGTSATVSWSGPLSRAEKHALTEELAAEQLTRLGDSPFELGNVCVDCSEPVMVPKSVLNQLRREAVGQLLEHLLAARRWRPLKPSALQQMRTEIAQRDQQRRAIDSTFQQRPTGQLAVLARSLEQLDAVLAWASQSSLAELACVYCDFEEIRRYREATERCRNAGVPVGLATLRILKPGEEGYLRQIAKCQPEVVLIRNLGSLAFFHETQVNETQLNETQLNETELDQPTGVHAQGQPAAWFPTLVGDFSLNVANELTADVLLEAGCRRVVPSYDLNWDQLTALLRRVEPAQFELVVHHYMPMFHMEHCVFAHVLSEGKDFRDCGRPCDHHRVELRDRSGHAFPLMADTGCRNTLYNALPQSAAEYIPKLLKLGVQHFRVELLQEQPAEVAPLLERYAAVLAGRENGTQAWRSLQAINQLGLTRGTLRG